MDVATAAKRIGNYGRNIENIRGAYKVSTSRIDFDEVLSMFIRSRKNGTGSAQHVNRSRTIKEYTYDITRVFDWFKDNRKLKFYSDVRRNDVADFIDHYQSLPLAASSKNKVFRTLRALFNFIRQDDVCGDLQLCDFSKLLPRIPKNAKKVYIPSPSDMQEFLKQFDKSTVWGLRDYVVTALIMDCGARIGEVCNLTPDCIKWEQAVLLIPDGKTGSRLVPVDRETMLPLLKRWLHERDAFAKTPYLFVTHAGGQCKPNTFDQSYKKARQRAGIVGEGNLTPHTVRHYFCTHYLINGGSLPVLQQITGHEELDTLMIYVHIASQFSVVSEEHSRVSPLKNLPTAIGKKKRKMF